MPLVAFVALPELPLEELGFNGGKDESKAGADGPAVTGWGATGIGFEIIGAAIMAFGEVRLVSLFSGWLLKMVLKLTMGKPRVLNSGSAGVVSISTILLAGSSVCALRSCRYPLS